MYVTYRDDVALYTCMPQSEIVIFSTLACKNIMETSFISLFCLQGIQHLEYHNNNHKQTMK